MRLKKLFILFFVGILCQTCANKPTEKNEVVNKENIKACCIDLNWRPKKDSLGTNGNNFAPPGAWANLCPEEHVQWLKELGCNTIQTFAVSCNGYAWYKNGVVPEQPGLEYDFLTEVVRIGRENGMKVFGYFCVGSNEKWGLEHPEMSYGTPHQPHIPFTKEYLNYLSASIKDAIERTDMDGFMIDWVWNPTAAVCGPAREQRWLECEKQMFVELMNKPFPAIEDITPDVLLEFNRRAIARCWRAIYNTTKKTKPGCKIWLSCSQLKNPEITNSAMLKQVDWLQNEAGDKESIDFARTQIGEHTSLLTTLSATFLKRMNLQAEDVVAYAKQDNIGIYCYSGLPSYEGFFPSVNSYIQQPVDSFSSISDKNIALLARVFNGYPPHYVHE